MFESDLSALKEHSKVRKVRLKSIRRDCPASQPTLSLCAARTLRRPRLRLLLLLVLLSLLFLLDRLETQFSSFENCLEPSQATLEATKAAANQSDALQGGPSLTTGRDAKTGNQRLKSEFDS